MSPYLFVNGPSKNGCGVYLNNHGWLTAGVLKNRPWTLFDYFNKNIRKYVLQNVQYAIPIREKENVWPTTRLFVASVVANPATLTNAPVVPFIKALHITEITEKFLSMELSKCLIQWNSGHLTRGRINLMWIWYWRQKWIHR